MRSLVILAAAATVGGCGGPRVVDTSVAVMPQAANWRQIATTADRTRLRNWRTTWLSAAAAARAADPSAVAAQGALFEPDRALPAPIPPAGTYRCRIFKLGAKGTATLGFTAYPAFECQVERQGDTIGFAKTSGSQRPVGTIFPDGSARGVFLGTLMLGDESGALKYGRDANRDLVGLVERIGPKRWRIAFPEPRFESQLDVIELVPAT